MHTLFSVLDFYARSLYDAKVQNRAPGTFKTNNQKLARRSGCSDTTIWRHLSRFMAKDLNIITSKTTHGPKADYELFFNPEYLIAQRDAYFNNFIKYHYAKAMKINQVPVEKLKQMDNLRPEFRYAKDGIYLISLCNLIDTRTIINFNMNQGIVEFSALIQEKNACAINEFNNNFKNNFPEQPGKSMAVPEKPEQFCAQNHVNRSTDTHVFLAWNYARKLLWPLIHFSEDRSIKIQRLIKRYFNPDDAWKNRPMIDLKTFCERITLVYRFLQRDTSRFVPVPELYFDTSFKHGFISTEKWHQNVLINRKKNEQFYYNHSLLISCYRNYAKNPGIDTYSKGRQLLSRKREKWLLDEYDKLILGISETIKDRTYLYRTHNLPA